MRFVFGGTRFVVLAGPYAVKIARVPLIRPILRIFKGMRDRDLGRRLARYDKRPVVAAIRYFGFGIIANRTEYAISRKHSNLPLARTRRMLLWGLVNIQERGEPATEADIAAHYFSLVLEEGDVADEILHCRQFCIIRETVVLADYGHPELEHQLG